MPELPTVGAPQVSPSSAPVRGFDVQPPAPSFLGGVVGQAAEKFGQVAEQTGTALEQHAIQFQQLNNRQAADQAAVAANAHIDGMVRDYLQNNPGMAAQQNLPQFYKDLETARGKFGEGLSLPAQIDFNTATRRWMGSAFATTSSQAAAMRTHSIDSTARAAAQQAVDKAATDPSFDFAGVIGAQAATLQKLHGWEAPEVEQFARGYVGAVYFGQAKRAIDDQDYDTARKVITDHGKDMTQQQLDAAMGPLKTLNHANQVSGMASAFLSGGTYNGRGSDLDLSTVARLEHSADGAVSPAGAGGYVQIMPNTFRQYFPNEAKGLSDDQIRAKLKDHDFATQHGQVILDDLHRQFPGDAEAQAIGWNAGPGRVPDWRAAGRDNSTLPAETQGYLSRLGQGHNFPGQGAITNDMDVPSYLGKVDSAAFTWAQDNIHDASLRDQFVQEVHKQATLATRGVSEAQHGTYDKLGSLIESGDIRTVTDLQKAHAGEWTSIPFNYQASLMSHLKTSASQMTPEQQAATEALDYQRISNPQAFTQTDIRGQHLPFTLERRFLDQQNKLRQSITSGKQLDTSVNQALKDGDVVNALKSAGLSNNVDPQQYGQFLGALGVEFEKYRDDPNHHGQLPQGKDRAAIVNNLLARRSGSFGFFGLGQAPMQFEVPADKQDAVRQSLERAGYHNPTPAQMYEAYQLSNPNGR